MDKMPGPQNVPKSDWFLFDNISLEKQVLMMTHFGDSNFQTFYFLKLYPIFVDSALDLLTKYNNFLGVWSVFA